MKNLNDFFKSNPQWEAVESVCRRLVVKGHSAYLVGGAVRDALLGLQPKDFDIGTTAEPEALFEIFPESIEVGKRFGIAIIAFKGFQVEIATFRTEGEYIDGRRPSEVSWCGPKQDSKRRDFTVNAIFYDLASEQIIDYQQGIKDLKNNLLRTVGNPDLRFNEDHLRILRALRFSAVYNLKIETQTKLSIKNNIIKAFSVSKERQKEEYEKSMLSSKSYRCLLLYVKHHVVGESFKGLENINTKYYQISEKTKAQLFYLNKASQLSIADPRKALVSDDLSSDFYLYFLFYNKNFLLGKANLNSKKHLWFLFSYYYFKILFLDKMSSKSISNKNDIFFNIIDVIIGELLALKLSKETIKFTKSLLTKYLYLQDFIKTRTAVKLMAIGDEDGGFLHQFLKTEEGLLFNGEQTYFLKRDMLVCDFLKNTHKLPESFLSGQDALKVGLKGKALGDGLKEAYYLQLEGKLKTRESCLEWLKQQ